MYIYICTVGYMYIVIVDSGGKRYGKHANLPYPHPQTWLLCLFDCLLYVYMPKYMYPHT